jgi:hypothetical protein
MYVDLDVARHYRRRLDVESASAEEIESPGQDISRFINLEGFKLCRSHSQLSLSFAMLPRVPLAMEQLVAIAGSVVCIGA